jgi:hypothetical protein
MTIATLKWQIKAYKLLKLRIENERAQSQLSNSLPSKQVELQSESGVNKPQ